MSSLTRRGAVALCLAGAAACGSNAGPTPVPSAATSQASASSRTSADGAGMRAPSASMPLPSLDRLGALREPALGDLDALVDRGVVRVLVTVSRTQYRIDDGQRGTLVDAGRSIQQALRDRVGARAAALTVECIPVAGRDVERAIVEGRGDMALTWFGPTTESAEGIARSAPALGDLREVAATGPGVPPLVSLEDLAGRDLFVVEGGRHDESLQRLNARLAEMGKPGFALVRIAAPLEDEDLLEMVNAGLIPATVVDSHIAAAWRLRLPNIAINEDVAVSQDAALAWVVRSGATAWLAQVNAWAPASGVLLSRPTEVTTASSEPSLRAITDTALQALAAARATLARSARLAHVSPALLAARAFEHQRLDAPALVDAAAALGVVMERDVPGVRVDQRTKSLLALAVMRTDASRVAQARADTARMGLDPDRWFGHVELGAARVLGRDVVDYVRRVAQYEAALAWRFAPPRRRAASAVRDQ